MVPRMSGWVLTDMGGPNAEITVAESVARMREILRTITPENSGTFFDIDDSIIPWQESAVRFHVPRRSP